MPVSSWSSSFLWSSPSTQACCTTASSEFASFLMLPRRSYRHEGCDSERSFCCSTAAWTGLFLDVLFQILRPNFRAINGALGIYRDAFGCAGVGGICHRVWNERNHGTILDESDPHASFPTGMVVRIRFRVSHVDHIVLVDEDSARAAELRPLLDELSVLVEDLDAVVGAVADEKPALGIERERVGDVELPWFGAVRAPGLDEFPVLVEDRK